MKHSDFKSLVIEKKAQKIDVIFSYYYQKKIESIILEYVKYNCINFHPAPLPKYRGVGNYCKCIIEELDWWGVSAHYMDEEFDNGDIIEVLKFKVNSKSETYRSLEVKTQNYMYELFCEILKRIENGNINILSPINREYYYQSKKEINKIKFISIDDTDDIIEKKIRAFWKPPFMGASIMINNKQYTLIDENILNEIHELYELYEKGSRK